MKEKGRSEFEEEQQPQEEEYDEDDDWLRELSRACPIK